MQLKGKTAIITGSARGIGQGIAKVFGREGANVVVNGLSVESCVETVKLVTDAGGESIGVAADVSKAADQEAMVAAAIKAFGTVDILVNNAGIEAKPTLIHEMSEQQWDKVLGVNLKGVFLGIRAVLPTMIANKRGRIINISSTVPRRPSQSQSVVVLKNKRNCWRSWSRCHPHKGRSDWHKSKAESRMASRMKMISTIANETF